MASADEQEPPPDDFEFVDSGGAPPASSTGLAALKQHVAQNKTEFVMCCSRTLQIIAALAYALPAFIPARAAYVGALAGALLTSALRLRLRLPPARLSREFAAAVLLEDATHYMLYALLFLYPPPLGPVLVPTTLLGFLHSHTYLLQLLDTLGPGRGGPARFLLSQVEQRSHAILTVVALTEIILLPYCITLLFAGRSWVPVPFVYYRFLTLRFSSRRNPHTRALFSAARRAAEATADSTTCPAPALSGVVGAGAALQEFSCE
ncbi:transmembrane protein 33-like [Pollicipes pollicipes]|uniref:transmembrane protein 33-like n=1 Tax=Pollicipes pollicipes TaxID=41117 RepID=UPI00188520BE|nr:transmembrane protein 33-like [Pollicipes pollicipes]